MERMMDRIASHLGLDPAVVLADTAAQLLGGDPADASFEGDLACLGGDLEKSVSLLDLARVANIGKHGIIPAQRHPSRAGDLELLRAGTRRVPVARTPHSSRSILRREA
jgi:hypothetical protein